MMKFGFYNSVLRLQATSVLAILIGMISPGFSSLIVDSNSTLLPEKRSINEILDHIRSLDALAGLPQPEMQIPRPMDPELSNYPQVNDNIHSRYPDRSMGNLRDSSQYTNQVGRLSDHQSQKNSETEDIFPISPYPPFPPPMSVFRGYNSDEIQSPQEDSPKHRQLPSIPPSTPSSSLRQRQPNPRPIGKGSMSKIAHGLGSDSYRYSEQEYFDNMYVPFVTKKKQDVNGHTSADPNSKFEPFFPSHGVPLPSQGGPQEYRLQMYSYGHGHGRSTKAGFSPIREFSPVKHFSHLGIGKERTTNSVDGIEPHPYGQYGVPSYGHRYAHGLMREAYPLDGGREYYQSTHGQGRARGQEGNNLGLGYGIHSLVPDLRDTERKVPFSINQNLVDNTPYRGYGVVPSPYGGQVHQDLSDYTTSYGDSPNSNPGLRGYGANEGFGVSYSNSNSNHPTGSSGGGTGGDIENEVGYGGLAERHLIQSAPSYGTSPGANLNSIAVQNGNDFSYNIQNQAQTLQNIHENHDNEYKTQLAAVNAATLQALRGMASLSLNQDASTAPYSINNGLNVLPSSSPSVYGLASYGGLFR